MNIDKEHIISIRREIHSYPEVDFDLPRTVALVKRELDAIGIPYTEKYGKGSVVGYINPDKEGFTIALRADMDALKITEKTDVEYKSKNEGYMHACGHDAHTAVLLGVAAALKELEGEISCRVKLLFQPSEEGMKSGAVMMIENGVMEDVDVIIGLHTENDMPSGKLGVCYGYSQASSRHFTLELFGKSAHATSPQRGIDALAAAVRIYNDLQLVLTRELDPLEKYVCSVCQLEAGRSQNSIADHALMRGTIRAYNMDVDLHIYNRFRSIIDHVCEETGVTASLTAPLKSVSLYNHPTVCRLIEKAIGKTVGEENVAHMPEKLSSEDFSRYLTQKPGAFFRLGTKNEEKGITSPAHTDTHNIDEDVLDLGAKTMVQFVLDNMNGISFE